MTTALLAVGGMHCRSCGLLIDDTLEDLDGVERAATDTRRGRTEVTYDAGVVDPTAITAAIAALGYTAAPTADATRDGRSEPPARASTGQKKRQGLL